MKFFSLVFIVLFFTATSGNAQPIITISSLPKAGDVFYYQFTKTDGLVIGSTGINQVWDYSSLVASSTAVDSVLPISSTPYGQLFPDANLSDHFVPGENNNIDSSYGYYQKTADAVKSVGFIYPGDTSRYISPLSFLQFPLTYGDFFTDSSIAEINYTGGKSSHMEIDSGYAIGYGTLKLPGNKIYENVLQVRIEMTQRKIWGSEKEIDIYYFKPGIFEPVLETLFDTTGVPRLARYLTNYTSASVYTFTGNGNWSDPANWSANAAPPMIIAPGTQIKIEGNCILDIPVNIPPFATLIVDQNATFIIQGNLTIH